MVLVNNRVGCALFSVVFRCAAKITDHLISKLCATGSSNFWRSVNNTRLKRGIVNLELVKAQSQFSQAIDRIEPVTLCPEIIDSCAEWDPDQGLLVYNVDCMLSNNKNKRDEHKNGTGLKYEWERKYYGKANNRNAIIERARAQILYKISCLLQHID